MATHCPTCRCAQPSPDRDIHDDPRWQLAQAETLRRLPGVELHGASAFRKYGLRRGEEIELIYEMSIPHLAPPSFPKNGWRSEAFDWVKPGEEPFEVRWDPREHAGYFGFWSRIVCYQLLLHLGVCDSPREAVRLLVESRRQQLADETARHAEWLRQRGEWVRIGAERYLLRLKRAVMEAGGPCTYCKAPNPRTVDHIVPSSRGGVDHPTNLTIACGSCNSTKGNRTPDEWRVARLAEGLCWPPPPSTQLRRFADAAC